MQDSSGVDLSNQSIPTNPQKKKFKKNQREVVRYEFDNEDLNTYVGELIHVIKGPYSGVFGRIALASRKTLYVDAEDTKLGQIVVDFEDIYHKVYDDEYRKKQEVDDLAFIDDQLNKLLEIEAYKFVYEENYDVSICNNYIWYDGTDYNTVTEEETELDILYAVNCRVIQLPTLIINPMVLRRMNDMVGMDQYEFKKMHQGIIFNWDYTFRDTGDNFNYSLIDRVVESYGFTIKDSDLMTRFKENKLFPVGFEFDPIVSLNRLYVPMLPRREVVRDTIRMFNWGIFYDKLIALKMM